jgi:Domain of unknown function (DUF4190)
MITPPQPVPPVGRFPSQPTNTMAIAAFACAFVLPPLAIILGIVAVHQINRSGEQGRSLAGAGIVLGYLFSILAVVAIVVVASILIIDLLKAFLWFATFQWASTNPTPAAIGHFGF